MAGAGAGSERSDQCVTMAAMERSPVTFSTVLQISEKGSMTSEQDDGFHGDNRPPDRRAACAFAFRREAPVRKS